LTLVAGLLDPLLARGLIDVLREDSDIQILAANLDRDALEREVLQRGPRVAVVGDTVEDSLLARLKAIKPAPEVVVIAHKATAGRGRHLREAGASCISQSADTAEILATVHRAAQGERTVVVLDHTNVDRGRDKRISLTKRQVEVFRHLSNDAPYAVIALEMQIGVQTVRTHARAIFRKLEVQSRQQLIGKSLPDGLE
jgi:DNA-binding NarL/FixJ family response regulator